MIEAYQRSSCKAELKTFALQNTSIAQTEIKLFVEGAKSRSVCIETSRR